MKKVFLEKVIQNQYEPVIARALDWICLDEIVTPQTRIFVKPNFTYPLYKPGVTTSPDFLDALLAILVRRTPRVIVGESDGGYRGWPAELALKNHGMYEICKRHGVELANLSKLPSEPITLRLGSKSIDIDLPSLLLHEVDLLLTVPVPKVHVITRYSGAMKNQWGCIPNDMRMRHHPSFDRGILALNQLLNTRFAVADATYMLDKTGPMDGEAVRTDMVIAADSPGALDLVCCVLMGLNHRKVKHLEMARLAGVLPKREDIQTNQDLAGFKVRDFELHRTLRNWVTVYAFSRPWAIKLIWDSRLGDLLHKILYSFAGNPVQDDVQIARKSAGHK